MKATDILMEEHEVILRVLDSLEAAAGRVERGAPVRPEFFLTAAEFIRGFADGCHHRKEEGVLFPAMAAGGLTSEAGPVAVMLAEHEQGRRFTRAMAAAADRMRTGESGASAEAAHNALGYVALLRQHIHKENQVLFPMAERAIPQARHAQLAEEFERVEHAETGAGVHERYLALADELAQELR